MGVFDQALTVPGVNMPAVGAAATQVVAPLAQMQAHREERAERTTLLKMQMERKEKEDLQKAAEHASNIESKLMEKADNPLEFSTKFRENLDPRVKALMPDLSGFQSKEKEELMALPENASLIDKKTKQVVIQGTPKEKSLTDMQLKSKALEEQLGRPPTATEVDEAIQKGKIQVAGATAKATEMGKGEAEKGLLSPKTMEDAYQYAKTAGEIPPELLRLFRTPKAQAEVINYIHQREGEEGLTGVDRAVTKSLYKADTSELTRVAGLHGIASVSQGAAMKHGQTVLDLAKRKDDTNIPAIDRWWRAGKKEIAGDKDVSALNIAMHMYTTETARYLTSMTSGGQLSEHEAERFRKLLSGADTPQMILKGVETINRMMDEKNKSFEDTRAKIKKDLISRGKPKEEVDSLLSGQEKPLDATKQAPPEAIEYLRKNPSLKEAFKAKYGYLPEGL